MKQKISRLYFCPQCDKKTEHLSVWVGFNKVDQLHKNICLECPSDFERKALQEMLAPVNECLGQSKAELVSSHDDQMNAHSS